MNCTNTKLTITLLLTALLLAIPFGIADGAIVGVDNFDYADGSIVGEAGGTGFAWDNASQTQANPSGASDWDDVFGSHTVSSGELTTNDGGAVRQYGSDEGAGAFQASGTVYYGVDFRLDDGATTWSGLSSYDFGAERIFFGMPGQAAAPRFFGIAESGITLSTIEVVTGQSYRLVAAVDFDGDELRLWIDPDAADFDAGTGSNSADVTRPYTLTNWSSAIRLASGGLTGWDNLLVTTTFAEAVPEPASIAMLFVAATLLVANSRRIF